MRIQKKRMLIVDDHPDITPMLKLNLEQTNDYEVRAENTSSLALAAAREFHPDLILLDVIMPGIAGGQLASSFAASPEFKGVPIVFLIAAATKEEISARGGIIAGAPFLAKPVSLVELVRCLKTNLS